MVRGNEQKKQDKIIRKSYHRRSPYGERELKMTEYMKKGFALKSLPMRGARIEKAFWWIQTGRIRSLSMRGARIEISAYERKISVDSIAPHTGSEN